MENGIYTRSEYQIVLYTKDGAAPFVIVNNEHFANQPAVLYGDDAEGLILAIAAYLNKDDNTEKGS